VSNETRLALHEFHHDLGAQFSVVNGSEVVADYGDVLAEHTALRETAGVIDLSFRGRLCLLGSDRVRFLHGQVTNDVKRLGVGEGCYAALVTAKGKMESDLNLFCLPEELLLDFEPGLTQAIKQRLEKYIVADDVQVVDVAPHYGMLSVQGPKAEVVVNGLGLFNEIPGVSLSCASISEASLGEVYLINHSRLAAEAGFDLFVPTESLGAVADKLMAIAQSIGGRPCGWTAFETARVEAGIPRFGQDLDETNIPLECGIEARAISYSKGCYIGQEVINRIHSIGHVNRELRGLRLADDLPTLPTKGNKLFKDGRELGFVTSAVASPTLQANIALGYVRREAGVAGAELILRIGESESVAKIVELPFAD